MILPEKVNYIINTLFQNGYNAYVVGGCVRDIIMNKNPSDWDICTLSTPEETLKCLQKNNAVKNGIKHGTVTVVFDKVAYEITTFRVDGDYDDNRHPKEVTFVRSLKEDLSRRDFTINAIAYNDKEGLCDFFGGENDIKNKLVRCVGDPDKRFKEDALRIMRALRFASVLGFDIEESTSESIHKNKSLLKNISAERIMSELSKLMLGKNAEKILIEYSDVLCVFIPEIKPMINFNQRNKHHIYDIWTHTVKTVVNTPTDIILRFAALFHDIGKPETFTIDENGVGHFYGHPKISESLTYDILKRLRFDNKTIKQVTKIIEMHDVKIIPQPKYVRRAIIKMGDELFEKLITLKRADALAQNPVFISEKLEYINELERIYNKNRMPNFTVKSLAVNGNDLINIGISCGEDIGICQKALFKLVVDGEIENKKEVLLEAAKEWNQNNLKLKQNL